MRRFALMIALLASPAGAEPWVTLDGAGVRAALEGRVIAFETARQDFRSSGRTLYVFGGRDSWGYWRVQGDQYCSQWPPSDLWACYDIAVSGAMVRFVGTGNDVTDGVYAD
ncbi:hypothetical protein [uncultured Tateyamaria sp.]|uniref:hypothetical protein n=1 Tax=Tateyamaria sp. 1078 TaxID=3417464 RepID=UPI002636326C|nr:hypothetical protein [uncultured Tateyamaria sp.]